MSDLTSSTENNFSSESVHGKFQETKKHDDNKIDFKAEARAFIGRLPEILGNILPGGKIVGDNYKCGSIHGGVGESFSVSLVSGVWRDFAVSGCAGGDVIALNAEIKGISMLESLNDLKRSYGGAINGSRGANGSNGSMVINQRNPPSLTKPPVGVQLVESHFYSKKFGKASAYWEYKDYDGSTMYYIARWDLPGGKKTFMPYSWDSAQRKWVNKAWPNNRPIYGLHLLRDRPNATIIICEGEKTCDALNAMVGDGPYIGVTWQGGSQAVKQTDWSSIKGRKIVIWPDNDQAGIEARDLVTSVLVDNVAEIKTIDVSDLEPGADAADLYPDLLPDRKAFNAWAKPRVSVLWEPLPADDSPMPGASDDPTVVDKPVGSVDWMTWGLRLKPGKDPKPYCNETNVRVVLENAPEFSGKFWYDTFLNKTITNWNSAEPYSICDQHFIEILDHIQYHYHMESLSPQTVRGAVIAMCYKNKRNEVKEWLLSLPWDGECRVATMLHDCFGVVDNEYTRAVSANLMKSLAARILEPGCKVDNVVILEGMQGTRKSTAIETLAGPKYFAEAEDDIKNKDFKMLLQGRLIIEIGELSSFTKAEVEGIKKIMSTRVDKFRPPYRSATEDFPRTCIFIGSTNDGEYLKDTTGNRRFWPVTITECDIDKLKSIRNELFAEAKCLVQSGSTWWEVPASAKYEQESRMITDAWYEEVEEYCRGLNTVSINDIATRKLVIDIDKIDRRVQLRIAGILRLLGFENRASRVTELGGKLVKRWQRVVKVDEIKPTNLINYAERFQQ